MPQDETPPVTPGPLGNVEPKPQEAAPASSMNLEDGELYNQFVGALPEDLRSHQIFKDTKNLKSLAEQTINAQRALGSRRIQVPEENWTDQQWEDFHTHLRPKTPDEYEAPEKFEVTVGEEVKEVDLPEELTEELRQLAHRSGMTNRQFSQVASRLAELTVQGEAEASGQNQKAVQDFANKLKTEWGTDYQIHLRAANETFEALSQEIPELTELVSWSPVVANHPAVLKLFARLAPLLQDSLPERLGQSGSFGEQTAAAIRSELDQINQEHQGLILDKQPTLLPPDRQALRQRILQRRTELYQKLHS